MKYRTIYMIKPEAFSKRNEIIDFIEKNSQLRVVKTKEKILTSKDISAIFLDDLGTQLFRAIEEHLINNTVQVVLVEMKEKNVGLETIINELSRVCGSHFDPSKCDANTVRYNYGLNRCNDYSGVKYFLNAIHKTSLDESIPATKWCIDHIFNAE